MKKASRKSTTFKPKKDGNPELEKLETELHEQVNQTEKVDEEKNKYVPLAKGKKFSRIMSLTPSKSIVFIGVSASVINGALMPIFGVMLGQILFILEDYSIGLFPVSC